MFIWNNTPAENDEKRERNIIKRFKKIKNENGKLKNKDKIK